MLRFEKLLNFSKKQCTVLANKLIHRSAMVDHIFVTFNEHFLSKIAAKESSKKKIWKLDDHYFNVTRPPNYWAMWYRIIRDFITCYWADNESIKNYAKSHKHVTENDVSRSLVFSSHWRWNFLRQVKSIVKKLRWNPFNKLIEEIGNSFNKRKSDQ